jgi:transposase
MGYSESFRQNVVESLLQGGLSLHATARKYDVSTSTVCNWKKRYANHSSMNKSKKANDWTPEQRLEAIIKTSSLSEQELGEYLRSNGLHTTDLESFKNDCLSSSNSRGRPKLEPEIVKLRKENKKLSSDLKRKDAALSEYAARVILLKKSHEIWGIKEDDE